MKRSGKLWTYDAGIEPPLLVGFYVTSRVSDIGAWWNKSHIMTMQPIPESIRRDRNATILAEQAEMLDNERR